MTVRVTVCVTVVCVLHSHLTQRNSILTVGSIYDKLLLAQNLKQGDAKQKPHNGSSTGMHSLAFIYTYVRICVRTYTYILVLVILHVTIIFDRARDRVEPARVWMRYATPLALPVERVWHPETR